MKKFIFSKVEGIETATFTDQPKGKKKFTKKNIRGKRSDRAAGKGEWGGGWGGAVSPPNEVKGPGVKPRKNLDFHDFHMLREAISDLFSS